MNDHSPRPIILTLVAAFGLVAPVGAQSRSEGQQTRPPVSTPVAPQVVSPEITRSFGPGDRGPISRNPAHAPGRTGRANQPVVDPTRPKVIPEDRPRVFIPPAHRPICTVRPDHNYWRTRDLFAEIQHMARRGFIRVIPVDGEVTELTGYSEYPAGWKAYGFIVPPKGKLHVRLHHSNEGWFRLSMMNKWGLLEPGMLQNLIPTGNPEASYTNLTDQVKAVYLLVDDPGIMATPGNPYTLKIERSWDPKEKPAANVTVVQGIWATNDSINAENKEKKG